MTASFIPVFADYLNHHPQEEVWEFANRLFWTVAAVLAVISALGIIFSKQVIWIFSLFGSNQPELLATAHLNTIMFPYIFFIGLAALSMAILNCFHIFGPPAARPVLLHIAIVTLAIVAVCGNFCN